MIKKVELYNFKCFDEVSLSLKNVNLLSGLNGMGKSTILQALLLLRQSYMNETGLKGLMLNGRYVRLGNAQDVLYEKAATDKIGIGFDSEDGSFLFQFLYEADSDYLPLSEKAEKIKERDIFGDRFSYLSAFRIEPRDLYHIENEEELRKREFGNNGEYAIQYLGIFGEEDVKVKELILDDRMGNSLLNQTRLWLDRISPGVSPEIRLKTQLRTSEVWYEFIEGKEKTNSYKSVNVGFGITYILPVIVAILAAKPGDIIFLENPEAHIHPGGQRMLGELIARAGRGGVQIIAETHSDHILNGVRLAVKKQVLPKENVKLFFFYKDMEDGFRHKCMSPKIMDDGRLDIWPDGYFDEWDRALFELF